MPVGDFGNAFSVFVAQNYGAGKKERIRQGIRQSVISVILFCIVISCGVFVLAQPLMQLFVSETSREIIAVGVQYLESKELLCRNRHFVYALWLLPCCEPPEHVGGAHGHFPWNKSAAVLHPLQISWLGVTGIWYPFRSMVPCGCGGDSGVSA